MMCFCTSSTLDTQRDTDQLQQGFHVLLPRYCATPPFQLPSAPVTCHPARSNEGGEADQRLPGALCQQGGCAAGSRGMRYNLLDLPE